VVNADTVFIDDVAARIGWHGVLRVQVDAASEALVFATSDVDKISQFAAVLTIPKKNLRASDLLECEPIGRCNDSRPTSAAVMFGRDEHWVSGFPVKKGGGRKIEGGRRTGNGCLPSPLEGRRAED
jgi:hypothetical protein